MKLETIIKTITSVNIITFAFLILSSSFSCNVNAQKEMSSKDRIYEFYQVDEIPIFKGNNLLIDSVLYTNLKWIDGESYVDGKVVISFLIKKDGSVNAVRVEKKLCRECDENALNAFEVLKEWSPGVKNGVKVNTRMYIPIYFELNQ